MKSLLMENLSQKSGRRIKSQEIVKNSKIVTKIGKNLLTFNQYRDSQIDLSKDFELTHEN